MKKVLKKASPNANPKNLTIFEDPGGERAVKPPRGISLA